MVAFGAEILDGTAEQAPLDARFDHQGQIGHREHLEHRDRRADVAVPVLLVAEAMIDTCSATLVRAITVFGV